MVAISENQEIRKGAYPPHIETRHGRLKESESCRFVDVIRVGPSGKTVLILCQQKGAVREGQCVYAGPLKRIFFRRSWAGHGWLFVEKCK